eukprot:1060213-Pleurochrysis_carterae.AAC.1
MPVHCCHKPGSSEHAWLAGTVSSGIAIKPDVIGKAGQKSPRFRIDVVSAVELVNEVLDSAAGTCINHNFAVSQAKAVQVYRLLCDAHADASRVLSRTGLSAVYIVLASLHHFKRLANPSDNAVKRLGALLTRKGGAKGAVGARAGELVVQLRGLINQRGFDDDLKYLSTAEAAQRLLTKRNSIVFSGMHFDRIAAPVAIASSSAAYVSSAASSSGAIPARVADPDRKDVGKGG